MTHLSGCRSFIKQFGAVSGNDLRQKDQTAVASELVAERQIKIFESKLL